LVLAIRALRLAVVVLCIREHPNQGVTTRVCERFGRGSLSVILWLVDGEVASPVMGKKDRGEEHSITPL
jgi:hypothetical protein